MHGVHPLTSEQREAALGNELARRVEELQDKWVRVVSSESGSIIGVSHGAGYNGLNGTCVFIQTGLGNTGRYIWSPHLTAVDFIEYVPSHGDGSSHGTTWEHFWQAVRQARANCEHHYYDNLFDQLINLAGEGRQRDGGGWEIILAHLLDLQFQDSRHFASALLELLHLAEAFYEAEHQELCVVAASLGMDRPKKQVTPRFGRL